MITIILLLDLLFLIQSIQEQEWPTNSTIIPVDVRNSYCDNLSGLYYNNEFLFAVKNSPSTLYKLMWDGSNWTNYQSKN